ncbi:hypothetical protein N7466_000857 [Penicillium verhagenii]|uniref:uncharacterized protein n=1 Tax=Penicillium verhagenii TaxID=1562060 RepID=UPI0025450303|nr:uncharacterized protein N7466_000857 [Penicillium verhagenii]KAJ5947842.1 hypothetical protein N7466_000857 [Penicillium verhagenii]
MAKWLPSEPNQKKRWDVIFAIICIAQTVVLTTYYFSTAYNRQDYTQPPAFPGQLDYWTDCGLSASEARARNCHFDPMLYAWIPHECFHPEPMDEYHPFEDRIWYKDTNLTQPLDQVEMEQLTLGNIRIAYTHTFHHEHCLYAMRKLAMATEKRWLLIDGRSADVHHATHCAKQIASFVKGTVEKTHSTENELATAHLQFPGCVAMPWRL